MTNAILEERVYLGCTVSEHEFMDIMVKSMAAGRLTWPWSSSWSLPSDPQIWCRKSKQDDEPQSPHNVTPPSRPQLLVLPSWVPPIEDWVFKCMSLCREILIQSFAGYKGCMDFFFTLFCQTLVAKDLIQNTHSFYLGWWKYPALLLIKFCRALKKWIF